MMRRSSRSPTPTRSTRSTPVDEPKSPLRQVPNDKVKIYVRLRPSLNEEEWNDNLSVYDQNTIQIVKSDLDTTYMKFDKILTSKLRQTDIFNNIDTSIQRFLQGENHSFFAYGQTGAGKTYTMIGDFEESSPYSQSPFLASEHRGILPRSLEKIISYLRTQQRKSSLQASFFEVYNEKVYDLLDPRPSSKKEGLGLRENKDGANQIIDLLKFEIRSVEDALQCLKVGLKNRVIGCSHANTKSSRSHAIFQLVLTQDDEANPNKKITSKLRIIDLAGSEKFIIPKELAADEKELHILELTSINQSLSTLGHCITALAESNRTHIPFRNSKLTRVLSDSLSGESKIIFIVCLSPSRESAQESFSTLQFASRAKKIILDGRQIRKKEEALRNNTRVLNKSNKVLELFKQLCTDKTLINTMFDPSIINKIHALENEVQQLKTTNKELQDQVSDLKRSHSPDLSYLKNCSHSYSTPFEKEERRCISTEPSPFDGEDEKDLYHPHNLFRKGTNSQSTSGISTAQKNLKYNEDYSEQGNSHRGDDINPFKGIGAQDKKVNNDDMRRMKEERANYLKFWSDTEVDTENSQDHSGDRSSVMDIIIGKQPNNLLAQKIKEKEIERKYEKFFAMDSREPSARSRASDNSPQMQSNALGNITNIFLSQNNEQMPKYNREGLWSEDTGDLRILNKNLQAGTKANERDYASGSRAYTSFNEQDGDNFYNKTEPADEVVKTETNYDSVGLDIIKEFDRKLLSVHQLNEQHQELIRNIGMKFHDWQQNRGNKLSASSTTSNRDENSQPVSMRSQASPNKKLSKSTSGRDIKDVVSNIKQELSDALTQIEYLKKGDTSASDMNVLTQQDTNVGSWADQTEDKSAVHTGRSLEKYTWQDMKTKDENMGDMKEKGIKRSENQKSGKSIGDILNRHWSTYKENIK